MALTEKQAAKAYPLILSIGRPKLRARKHIKEAGFTLVEIMTVLVIIGLMSSAVILTMPSAKPEVQTFSSAVHRDLNRAAQTSLLSGKVMALGLSDDAYSLLRYEEGEWRSLTTQSWPEGVVASVKRDASSIDLTDVIVPVALFEPVGTSSVFSLTLTEDDISYQLLSVGDGQVSLGALP